MIDAPTLQKLRELASQATPGPWRYHMGNVTQISDGGKGYPLDYYPDCADVVTTDEADAQIITNDDAEYIAAANPQTVLALLDHVNDLEQQRDADIARGLGDALAIVQRRLGHYQRMTGPEMKAHPATIATLEEIAVFIEAALMRALEPDREPGDGYCACGERLDKPHNHDGDFR